MYGLGFWLPKMLVAEGVSATNSGWWAALPYGVGSVGMILLSRLTGRSWLGRIILVSGIGFAAAGLANSFPLLLAGFSLAAIGAYSATPLFWSASNRPHERAGCRPAIATVNSIGVLGGFAAPSQWAGCCNIPTATPPGSAPSRPCF